jgi:hypothetical protein
MKTNVAMADPAPGQAERFSVVVAYEDGVTRDRALQLRDRLEDRLWGDFEFDFSWWKFEYLRDRAIAQAAVEAAARAEVIIFSAHARPELPVAVRHWIDAWLARREARPGALAALIGTTGDKGVLPLLGFLREVAERAQMDFLPGMGTMAAARSAGPSHVVHETAQRVTSALKKVLDPRNPPTHWGINE